MGIEGGLPSCIRVRWEDVIMACLSLWAWKTGLLRGVPKREPSQGGDNGARLLVGALLQWADAFAWRSHRG